MEKNISDYKLGIVGKVDSLGTVPIGDEFNYMDYIIDEYDPERKFAVFDWRDIGKDLTLSRYVLRNYAGHREIVEKSVPLEKICDLMFIKQLGSIHREKEQFLSFLSSLDNFNGVAVNNPDTFRKNLSKAYLTSLQDHGFPVVPTVRYANGASISDVRDSDFSSINNHYSGHHDDIVVKPEFFGEKGHGVRKLSSFNYEEDFAKYVKQHSPFIAQPFIPEIVEYGERSLIFLGKDFSHGVAKYTGEFLINVSDNAVYTPYEPTSSELKMSRAILDGWPDKIGYTRIDLIHSGGIPFIGEVEMGNPAFYIANNIPHPEIFMPRLKKFIDNTWSEYKNEY